MDPFTDHADGAHFAGQAVKQERAPDDVEQFETEKSGFHTRPGQDLPGAAEEKQAHQRGHDPAGRAGAHTAPFENQHQHHHGQDWQKRKQPGKQAKFHRWQLYIRTRLDFAF